jgi:hypothetical protein
LTRTNALSAIDERLKGVFAVINDFPGSAAKDILFLKTLSREEDVFNFITRNNVYRDVYIFGSSGDCVARINALTGIGAICNVVPDVVVRVEREWPKDMAQDIVYISPVVLYKDAPALIYATRRAGGSIVSVIDANYFLEEIRRLSRDGEAVYLLLRDGSYLAHPNRAKEKLFGGEDNFYHDFTDVLGGALDDPEMRRFESDAHIFTFWRIHPSISNFAIYEGARALYGKEQADEDYWIMVAVSEKPDARPWWQKASYLTTVGLIVLLHVFLVASVYVATRNKIPSYE